MKLDPALVEDITFGKFEPHEIRHWGDETKAGPSLLVLGAVSSKCISGAMELTEIKPLPPSLPGTVLPPKAPYDGRASALAAGFPETTSLQVINRLVSLWCRNSATAQTKLIVASGTIILAPVQILLFRFNGSSKHC